MLRAREVAEIRRHVYRAPLRLIADAQCRARRMPTSTAAELKHDDAASHRHPKCNDGHIDLDVLSTPAIVVGYAGPSPHRTSVASVVHGSVATRTVRGSHWHRRFFVGEHSVSDKQSSRSVLSGVNLARNQQVQPRPHKCTLANCAVVVRGTLARFWCSQNDRDK